MNNTTVINANLRASLLPLLERYSKAPLFLLTDENTQKFCLPILYEALPELHSAHLIAISAGDAHKTLDSAVAIWNDLCAHGATRHSLMINIGGGQVTDIGGFTAATFKRGMPFVHLPTTLLGAVDAATGDKTGINFNGLKNEIGLFAAAEEVLIYLPFFQTLDTENRYSGFAEMVKHALIHSRELLATTYRTLPDDIETEAFARLLDENLKVKNHFVEIDRNETGLRKALNFGHSFGHAFEALSLRNNRPILHGTAVIWGLVCEMLLSHIRFGLDKNDVSALHFFAHEHYRPLPFSCRDYDAIFELMKHDKKSIDGSINLTLLRQVGDVAIDQTATKEEIFECLDFIL